MEESYTDSPSANMLSNPLKFNIFIDDLAFNSKFFPRTVPARLCPFAATTVGDGSLGGYVHLRPARLKPHNCEPRPNQTD